MYIPIIRIPTTMLLYRYISFIGFIFLIQNNNVVRIKIGSMIVCPSVMAFSPSTTSYMRQQQRQRQQYGTSSISTTNKNLKQHTKHDELTFVLLSSSSSLQSTFRQQKKIQRILRMSSTATAGTDGRISSGRNQHRFRRILRLFGITVDGHNNHQHQQQQTKKVIEKYRRNRQIILRTKNNNNNNNNTKNKNIDTKDIETNNNKKKNRPAVRIITTIDDLHDHWNDTKKLYRRSSDENEIDYTALVRGAKVIGDTQIIGSAEYTNYTHPVAQLIHERSISNYTNQEINDGYKIAVVVEGGGMRGCVSAGMICAIHYLNLTHTIDALYGSSAGTIVASYLITGQLPWFGPELYYDSLTTAGRNFIDTRRILRALGLGLLDPRLYKDVITRPSNGKPVLNLNYLLKQTVQGRKKLDWDTFVQRQPTLPLNIIVSALRQERSYSLNMNGNNAFETLEELTDAMHASCLLPGIAGPTVNIHKDYLKDITPGRRKTKTTKDRDQPKYQLGNNWKDPNYEPLADALLFEPLPYASAVRDGATHVLVIRSRPDGVDVTGKGGIIENMIAHRFFVRKNNLPNMYQRLRKHLHKKLYGENVIFLNSHAHTDRQYTDATNDNPHYMTMAVAPGSEEVSRLEVGREAIFEGLRRGFARAYDCLVPDPSERGKGTEMAKLFFPDEILQYDPTSFETSDVSAFELYMKQQNIIPKIWEQHNDNKYKPPIIASTTKIPTIDKTTN